MRNRLWFRTLASLLAMWFPLIAGEPGLLHPCPMHGAGAAVAATLTGHSHAHANHAASHHAAASGSHGAPAQGHHDCTCIDGCCASFSAAGAPEPVAIVATFVERASQAALSAASTLARPAPEYARPYTTGPPRA